MSLNKKFYDDYIWSLKYRPTTLQDVAMPIKLKKYFNDIVSSGHVPNMLFHGNAGIGKTTVATIIADTLGYDTMYINGSLETSIDVLRGKVKQFVSTVSFDGNKKIVIIDESDRISIQGSEGLKSFLEEFSKSSSFVFITNNINKIIDPIKSRLQTVEFVFNNEELLEIKKQFAKSILNILDTENVAYDKRVLSHIINNNYPDMRKTLNELQKNSSRLNDISVLDDNDSNIEEYFTLIKNRDFVKLQTYCANISDSQTFFSLIYGSLKKYIDNGDIPAMIVLTSDYCYKIAFVKDHRITLMAYTCEVMNNIKLKG